MKKPKPFTMWAQVENGKWVSGGWSGIPCLWDRKKDALREVFGKEKVVKVEVRIK